MAFVRYCQKLIAQRLDVFIVIAALWTASVFGAFEMMRRGGRAEFSYVTPGDLFAAGAAFSLAGWVVLAVASFALSVVVRRDWVGSLLFAVVFYGAITALVLPLPSGRGMENLADLQISKVNLIVSLTLSFVSAVLLTTKMRAPVLLGAVALSLSSLSSVALQIGKPVPVSGSPLSLSGDRDIVVLSFDGLQRDVFSEAMESSPLLVDRLNNFTFFDNVISSSPATNASLAAELLGNFNFKDRAQTTEELIGIAKKNGVHNALSAVGYRIGGYYNYASMMAPHSNLGASLSEGNPRSQLVALVKFSLSRCVGPRLASSDAVTTAAAFVVGLLPVNRTNAAGSIADKVARHAGPEWDRSLLLGWDGVNRYVQRVSGGAQQPIAHFLHFTFTHHPVDFSNTCEFASVSKAWHSQNQNKAGLVGEAVCSIRIMEQILSRLDEVGAFYNNLVIIKSDHGAPVSWNSEGSVGATKIRGHDYWGFGRYLPILMIKPPGQTAQRMPHDSRPAVLDDLANSLCRWATERQDCDGFPGMDLLNPNGHVPPYYWLNIVRSKKSDFKYDTHESIRIRRTDDPMKELADFLARETMETSATE